jgi:hypothetical protein
MQPTLEDIQFFYQSCLATNVTANELVRLKNLALKCDDLGRFAAVLPIVATTNVACDKALSPQDEAKFLKLKTSIIATNLKQQAFIKQLGSRLLEENVTVILLKSTAFNGYLYENSAPRGNSDIDILVHPNDKQRLEAVLQNMADLYEPDIKKPFEGYYEQTWIAKKDKSIFIDVHTSLTNPLMFKIDIDELFNTALSHPAYLDNSLKILTPEANLIHLATHISKDGYLPHHSLVDAAKLRRIHSLDTVKLIEFAKRWQCIKATSMLITSMNLYLPQWITDITKELTTTYRTRQAIKIMGWDTGNNRLLKRLQQLILQYLLIDTVTSALGLQIAYFKRLITKAN